MTHLDPRAFTFALQKVTDGFLFETFAQDLMACLIGRSFIPAGGVKDKGIDALEHCFEPEGLSRVIYQMSIEKDPKAKMRKSLAAIKSNDIDCAKFVYVTNQEVKDLALLTEELFEAFNVAIECRDIAWLRAHVGANEAAIRVFHTFIESHLHEFARRPDDEFLVKDYAADPRVFVFIRQQWDDHRSQQDFGEVVVDSLILLALEGTDPDKGILLTRSEVRQRIMETLPQANLVDHILEKRLSALSSKPRRINHHRSEDAYCLPYETRLQLDQKNLEDRQLHEGFFEKAQTRLSKHLELEGVKVSKPYGLVSDVLKQCFRLQGLQFSDFIHTTSPSATYERTLDEVITRVLETSQVMKKDHERVGRALMATVRELMYQGDDLEKAFLRRLSDTYLMMFLMQGDPEVASFFASLATKLNLYVDNSIIIPALSEFHLEPRNRRFWNLLVSARRAGVTMRINRVTIDELVAHLSRVFDLYEREYHAQRDVYSDENSIRYVDEILLRSYFYQRMRGQGGSFRDYLNNFATPNSPTMREELVEFMRSEFGIRYVEDSSVGVRIDKSELEDLTEALEKVKRGPKRAQNDARTILTIFAIREKHNELGDGGVFGYRTWWLSQDTQTYAAVQDCFGEKYSPSCYLRPDFLYNFITLAPSLQQSEEVFDTLFPSLLGITVSHHVDGAIVEVIRSGIKAHSDLPASRKRAALRSMTDNLKSGPKLPNLQRLTNYLDEQLRKG